MNNIKPTITATKSKSILLTVLFLCLILFPLLNKVAKIIPEEKNSDFNYSSKPQLHYSNLDEFPPLFEKYYNERVGFTQKAVTFNAYFKTRFLKISPNTSKVVLGKNNWLFLAGKSLQDYRGLNLLSQKEVTRLKDILHQRALRLKEQGGIFYLALIPNKHRVYSEFLPSNILKTSGLTVYDQTVEALKNDTLIHLIDLREPLEAAKKNELLYYKKDNHWNDLGAYVGYNTIIKNIRKQFPSVALVPRNMYHIDTSRVLIGGEALQIGVDKFKAFDERRIVLEPDFQVRSHSGIKKNYPIPANFEYGSDFEIVKIIDDTSFPTAVIIRDSFSDFMLQFLSESFSKTIFIFDNWEYKENSNIIKTEKPDIVVLEVIEQNISRILECDKY